MAIHARQSAAATVPPVPARRGARRLARLAFLLAGAAAVAVIVAGVLAGVLILILASAGTAAALAAAWWFLSRHGWRRWLAGALVVAAPLAVVVLLARRDRILEVVVFALVWTGALAAGRRALALAAEPAAPAEYDSPAPLRPYLIMNPRSGGGKVERFRLAERARSLGAEVALLGGPGETDVADLARQAIRDGADLLGVAGGDGTQARVAAVAAAHDVPFMVISAGTRNHFALDLGLDRDDPATCLDALRDGVEVRVDLGEVGDRTFVNNASFGAYAQVVQSAAYRDDKVGTTLDLLPDLLAGHQGPRLTLHVNGTVRTAPQAVLISNNPYGSGDVAGLGRRFRLDGGVLGVLAVTVRGALDAAGLVRGRRWTSRSISVVTATEAVVDADTPSVPVGLDGEAITVPVPVHCRIRPGALRVRVPRNRPGVPPPRPELDWVRLRRLAWSPPAR